VRLSKLTKEKLFLGAG